MPNGSGDPSLGDRGHRSLRAFSYDERVSALVFLLIVLVVSGVGALVLWLQHRSPTTLESGIESFQREMRALAPDDDDKGSTTDGRR